MKTLKEQILGIIGFGMETERAELKTSEIESLIREDFVEKEFVKWEHLKTITSDGIIWYIITEHGDIKHDLDEVFNYWLNNIKDK